MEAIPPSELQLGCQTPISRKDMICRKISDTRFSSRLAKAQNLAHLDSLAGDLICELAKPSQWLASCSRCSPDNRQCSLAGTARLVLTN
jgi:hypothetical protein